MQFKDYVYFLGKISNFTNITAKYYLPHNTTERTVSIMDISTDHININQQQPAKPVDNDIVIHLIDRCIDEVKAVQSKSREWMKRKPLILSSLTRVRVITPGLLGYIKALEDTRKLT